MIFVTGDTHAQFDRRFNTKSFPEQKEMTKDDYLIICGDFGGIWVRGGESNSEKHWLDWFNDRSYTLLFIDGNHENFDRLEEYPQKEWKGGKVHVIRPSIYHLMRGQVYEIDGKKIFTFGGASSHDMSGGLLDPEDPDYLTPYIRRLRTGNFTADLMPRESFTPIIRCAKYGCGTMEVFLFSVIIRERRYVERVRSDRAHLPARERGMFIMRPISILKPVKHIRLIHIPESLR